jgi:hypothetical protein
VAMEKLGYANAIELSRVLADLEVSDISDFEKRIMVKAGISVAFRSGHPRNLGISAARPDWSKVSRLMITAIEPPNV